MNILSFIFSNLTRQDRKEMSLFSYLSNNFLRFSKNKCIDNYTYKDMHELTKYYVDRFKDMRAYDRVCVAAPKSAEWVAMMTAVWQKKGIWIPLPALEERFLQKCKPNFTVEGKALDFKQCLASPMKITDSIPSNEMATILFTSGSTNEPKGVVLSHHSLKTNLAMIDRLYSNSIREKDVSFSLLPWYHCYGLVCELLYLLGKGSQILIPKHQDDPLKMFREIRSNHPTLLYTVPKILDRVQKNDIKYIPRVLKKRILWGDRLRMMSVGGSVCDPATLDFIRDTYRIDVLQGYGMTECCPMIALNSLDANKQGSVGKPLHGIEIKIDENNEVIVSTPSFMKGYLVEVNEANHHISTTSQSNDWFATGDKGFLDAEGYLYVRGRLKNEYKLSNGKFVDPEYLEKLVLSASTIISQILLFPSKDYEYNVCLVYPSSTSPTPTMIVDEIKTILQNKGKRYEIPRRFHIMREPFSQKNQLLSLKLEPRREIIIDRFYQNRIPLV